MPSPLVGQSKEIAGVIIESPSKTSEVVYDWIYTEFEETEDLDSAIEHAVDRVIGSGFLDEFFREVGANLLRDIWRSKQRASRVEIERSIKRHDTNPLKTEVAMLESLYPIEGRWRRLGDLGRVECELLEYDYRQRAAGNVRVAEFFASLARRMEGGQSVRDVYSEEQVRAMMEKVMPADGD